MDKVELCQFLSHRDRTFDLDDVTFITGPNGSGKSSVLAGIEWVVTGSCRGLPEAGRRNRDLRRIGADSRDTFVRLHGPDGPYAERRYDPAEQRTTLQVAGVQGGNQQAETELWRMLGVRAPEAKMAREIVRLCLRAGDMTTWTAKTWTEVQAMLSGGSVKDVLTDLATFLRGARHEPQVIAQINAYVVQAKDSLWSSLATVQSRSHVTHAFERYFYQERTNVGRELRNAEARATPAPEDPALAAMPEDALVEDRNKLLTEISTAETESRTQRSLYDRAESVQRQASILKDEARALKAEIDEAVETIAARPTADQLKEAEQQWRAADVAKKKLEKSRLSAAAGDDDVARAVAVVVEKFGDQLSKTSMAKLRQVSATQEALPPPPDDTDYKVACDTVDRKRRILDEMQQIVTTANAAENKLPGMRERLARMSRPDAVMPGVDLDASPESVATYLASAESWDQKVRAARGRLVPIERELQRRAFARQNIEKDTSRLRILHTALDVLVDAMREPAVKTGSGGAVLKSMELAIAAGCNAVLGRAPSVAPDGTFRFDDVDWDLLSTSERMRFGCTVSAAIGSAAGFPWLLIDGVDVLTGKENRNKFLAWIEAQRVAFKRIILTAAAAEAPKGTLPAHWKAYHLGDA